MKVAVLYIGIGKYIDFWKGFYVSCEEHFLKNVRKDYFVFSDAEHIFAEDEVHKIFQEDLGWPGNSLMRYTFFMKILSELGKYDYIYFFNGNVLFLQDITEEEFCPQDDSLLVIEHHYFVDKPNEAFPYDRNEKSTAYIPFGEGEHYVCGGINGGKAETFINFVKTLYYQIEEDNKNGIVALWHDESHVNRYILDHKKIKLLPPSYCYPELVANPNISLERKIICRDKRKSFNLYRFKEPEQEIERLTLDSKRLLQEEHYERLEHRWLNLKARGINLGEYFKDNGITHIVIVSTGRLADLFYSELMYKDINVVKIIDKNNIEFCLNGIKPHFSEKWIEKHFATVITDTFNFSKTYEAMLLKGEKNIISLEDIINTLYEKKGGNIKTEQISLKEYKTIEKEETLYVKNREDLFPIDRLTENCKVVLYGGGKVGQRYYSMLQLSSTVQLILWVDADYRRKQKEGMPIHSIDVIQDTLYDYIILGTSVKITAESMKETLERKGIDLKKVIWFNKNLQTWENV